MPSLEEYIKKNREQFDDRSPRKGFWNKIEEQLFGADAAQSKGLWHSLGFWRAAAAVLLLVTFAFAYNTFKNPEQKALTALEKDFAEIERYYLGQITEKSNLISIAQGAWSDESSSEDLLKLEAMYMVLKEEMRKRPSQEVKDALELNLIVRLDIIHKRLERSEELKEGSSI